uniref:Uncharacterized protein n=1 Tax=Phytophthora ramorum TaxID=164328 RepID=H3HBV2_PHYRM
MAASPFPATVEPAIFNIKYHDNEVGAFLSPMMTIRHGVNNQVFPNATLQIRDRKAWDEFAGDMMRLPNVQYEISGSLNIHVRLLGGLVKLSASDIPLKKTMKFEGMDGLRDMQIADVDMSHSTQEKVLATIKTCIRNPSITTIRPVGALCLNAHSPKLGEHTLVAHLTTSTDTSLPVANSDPSHPFCALLQGSTDMAKGYNLLELQGEMLGTNSEAISGLITKYLGNVSAELTVVTCESQATSVDLYNQAMKNLTINSALPPQKDPLVGNMFFRGISLHAPEEGKANEFVRLDTAVLVEATSPLGPNSALTITDVHMNVSLNGADVALGTLSTLSVNIIDGKLVDRSNISVDCLTQLDFAEKGEAFGRFVRASVVKEQVPLTLAGSMNVVCHGALGTLKLTGLPLRTTALLKGMNNFQDVTVQSFSLPGTGSASANEEPIQTQIEIRNPSVFTVAIGTLTMDLGLNAPREKFGTLRGTMNLAPGKNELEMNGQLKPVKDAAGQVRTDMKAKVKMPASINMPLKISNLSVALTLENESGRHLGSLVSDRETCEFNQTAGGAFRLNMSHFYPIAMDSFRHPPVKVLSVDIQHGSKSSMVMTMEFSLQNPSIVQTKLGSLVLDVFFEGTRMGSAKISDFSLNCCGKPTILQGNFDYNPRASDLAVAERFLSNFIAIKGSTESTSLDLLQPAMKDLSIPSKLPTLTELFPATPTLVTSSLLYIPSLFHLTQIPTSLELRNPFSENITVTMVDLELYPCEDQVSGDDGKLMCKKYFAESLARFAPAVFQSIFIPANTNGCFSCCQGSHCDAHVSLCPRASAGQCMSADVQSFLSPEAIATIIHSLTGGLLMRVNGTIGASIGGYATRLFYQQDGLLVTMAK